MKKKLFFAMTFLMLTGIFSYQVTYALFVDTATSSNNTFTAASEFPITGPITGPIVPGKIVINEVFEAAASSSAEWVELFNSGGSPVNVSGWRITDQNDLNTLSEDVLPTTSAIPPGGYAVIVTQGSTVGTIPGSATTISLTNGTIGSGLNSTSENVYLKSDASTVVDQMGYGTSNVFGGNTPSSPPSGESVRRIPNGTDTDLAGDWQNGTPSLGVTN